MASEKRESLASRLGFLLVSAGCAIGLGNVWRFPYITGEYGGAWFVILFILCTFLVMPVMIVEFSIGRASRRNLGLAYHVLEPKGTKWHRLGWWAIVGSYMLLMFYVVVTGWLLLYCWYMLSGAFTGLSPAEVGQFFGGLLATPSKQILGMTLTVAIAFGVCIMGLQAGVERVVKILMAGLFLALLVLVVKALTLEGAGKGLEFYLMPNFENMQKTGFLPIFSAALNQAFFALSVGIGAMTVFGSYLNKEKSLPGEVLIITGLDFMVAILSGLIIFPVCFTFGVEPSSGPGLVFVTLPNIFTNMAGGRLWGCLFFVFMSFAALTTVIAVFENMVNYFIDVFKTTRRSANIINGVLLWILALPCALGYSVFSDFQPFGPGSSVLDLEDFIVSNHLLPLGSFILVLFCTLRCGWGWENFEKEANAGNGLKLHKCMRFYLRWILPPLIIFLFVIGYIDKFSK